MRKYKVFSPKKTRYTLFFYYLTAVIVFIFHDFIGTIGSLKFFGASLGFWSFPVIIFYYSWRKYEDQQHTEEINEDELNKRLEKINSSR